MKANETDALRTYAKPKPGMIPTGIGTFTTAQAINDFWDSLAQDCEFLETNEAA